MGGLIPSNLFDGALSALSAQSDPPKHTGTVAHHVTLDLVRILAGQCASLPPMPTND